jgi:hypothetical protein
MSFLILIHHHQPSLLQSHTPLQALHHPLRHALRHPLIKHFLTLLLPHSPKSSPFHTPNLPQFSPSLLPPMHLQLPQTYIQWLQEPKIISLNHECSLMDQQNIHFLVPCWLQLISLSHNSLVIHKMLHMQTGVIL